MLYTSCCLGEDHDSDLLELHSLAETPTPGELTRTSSRSNRAPSDCCTFTPSFNMCVFPRFGPEQLPVRGPVLTVSISASPWVSLHHIVSISASPWVSLHRIVSVSASPWVSLHHTVSVSASTWILLHRIGRQAGPGCRN